jgi:hypothetical protein
MESTQGNTTAQVWLAHHNLGVVDYKALTGLSLLRVPHFRARRGASLEDLNPDTSPRVKPNVFPSADKIQGNTPISVKHSSYEDLE